jgi:glyoxylase-like metal-dependent hydrolase (beta-lactamase superfamily II)
MTLTEPRFRKPPRHQVFALAVLFATLLAGCTNLSGVNVGTGVSLPGGVRVGANKQLGQGSEPTRTSSAEPTQSSLKLYVFNCGILRFKDVTAFGLSNQDTDVRQMFVPCYVIEHPKGRLLWDAGLPPALVGKGEQPLSDGNTQEYRESLVKQLTRIKLRPRDIDLVAFSHMHFDHVGSANAFTDAQLLIQETEYDAAFKNYEDNPYFEYALYNQLAPSTKILLTGDHDVFGDGKVKIISAPGHTPGHQVLYLNLKNMGPLVLSGDLYHFEASRRLRAVPEFNTDKAQTLESMAKVEELIEKTRATLWIEHNMALAEGLDLAPAFYD